MAVVDEIARILAQSPSETEGVGRRLGQALVAGDLVNLKGDLGAGKTLFVKGLAASLGYDPTDVQSPTFTLVNEYRGERLPLYHLDLYRLDDPLAEIDALGFDEYLQPYDGVTAVEWGDLAPQALAPRRIDVMIDIVSQGREITLHALELEPERIEELRRLFRSPASSRPHIEAERGPGGLASPADGGRPE